MQTIEHPWLKSYPEEINWEEAIEPKPIYEMLNYAVDKFPHNPAIDFIGHITNYEELGRLADKFAFALENMGIYSGTKIGIYMPNCPQFVIAYFGILKAGCTVVNYSPLYSIKELEYQIEDSDTEILITLDLKLLYPKAKELLNKNGKLKKIVVSRFCEFLPFPKNILFKLFKGKDLAKASHDENIICWSKFLSKGSEAPKNYAKEVNLNDTAIIQYTGGTTGVPKGAELSHSNVYTNTVQSKLWCKHVPDGDGSILTVLPLFHVFAMTTCMNFGILTAAKLILHPRFELKKVLKDIDKKLPTAMPGVATMYNAINNYSEVGNYDLGSLKACISGGGPLPVEIKRKFENLTGCTVIEGYGLTEASPVVSANPYEGTNKEGSIGMPLPQTEVVIEDIENRGNFLGANETGELCVKGPQVMKGYYKRKEATDEVIFDGILRTGDIAKIDEDGYIFITDRLKEMIICAGFKVYPRHVEEIIYQHPDVLECAVIGIHDDYSGQKVKAVIVTKKGHSLSKEDIHTYLKDKVAKHEMPKEIEFRDSLPKSPIGKILKKELK